MSDLLAGYDAWLDAPYQRQMDREEEPEASEEDDEDLWEEE